MARELLHLGTGIALYLTIYIIIQGNGQYLCDTIISVSHQFVSSTKQNRKTNKYQQKDKVYRREWKMLLLLFVPPIYPTLLQLTLVVAKQNTKREPKTRRFKNYILVFAFQIAQRDELNVKLHPRYSSGCFVFYFFFKFYGLL